jgi:hypothetical protein
VAQPWGFGGERAAEAVTARGRKAGRPVVVVAVAVAGMEVGTEAVVGPQMESEDETTGECYLDDAGGARGDVRGARGEVRGDVRGEVRDDHGDDHDGVHACVGACGPLRGHASQPSRRLHHPARWTHRLEFPGVSHCRTRRNEGDHLATRGHGRDERAARTLLLNGLPCQ